ncbi:MAG: hypothetical protein NZ108_06545 [Bacteroidia bacterium]|nr:hypothetical protein [Bacteroidia bacterium]
MTGWLVFWFLILFQVGISQPGNRFHAGSAKTLSGNIYTLSIFVSTPGRSWSYADKIEIYRKQREAENWLIQQAKRYQVELQFVGGNYGLDNDIQIPEIPTATGSGKEKVDWVSYILREIGYKSSADFHQWVLKNTNCKQTQVLIYANQEGRPYAMPYATNMDSVRYFVEGAFLYQYYSPGLPIISATIAHEMLHLYGAWDLYKTYAQTEDRAEAAAKHFPKDIMRKVDNLKDLEISKLTAWLIGWNSKPEEWYEWFRPADFK